MHDNDPQKDRSPVDTPVMPATPVVNDTTGPVPTVVVPVDPEYRRSMNYFPYVAAFVFAILGIWGLMTLNDRDNDLADQPTDVAYVEQHLEPEPSPFDRAPMAANSRRMAEDQTRDDMKELRREEIVRDADRIDDYAAPADPYDNEVASVDLDESPPATDTIAAEPAAQQPDPNPAEIAVMDLDYSSTPMVALSEPEVGTTVTQLDADIDATEDMARDTGQSAGLEILEERLDALEDRIEDTSTPMSEPDRLAITRQLSELRDELTAFQMELRTL